MKTLVGIIAILLLFGGYTKAQSSSTARVNFLSTMHDVNVVLRTNLEQNKPIRIKFRTWVTMHPVNDSLSFVVNDKLYSLHFEPNKQYYFVFEKSHPSGVSVVEKTEREFIIMAMLNSAKGPEELN